MEKKANPLDEIPLLDGSYDPTYIYKAKMKNNHWREAKIIDVKPLVDSDTTKIPKQPSDFRYYMHFYGVNRRMDDWVLPHNIVKTSYTL